jgi:hypothetical protein
MARCWGNIIDGRAGVTTVVSGYYYLPGTHAGDMENLAYIPFSDSAVNKVIDIQAGAFHTYHFLP